MIQKSLFKRPTLSIILERELVSYEMSGRCTFSASHNAVSSRFQDNDDIKNDKKRTKNTINYYKKIKKTRMIPHKKNKKITVGYPLLLSTSLYYTHT